jgi:hypothetical protein
MDTAAAEQDVWELIYLLVDQKVYTDMLLWALKRAATGQWRIPSANEHNGVTTQDMALRVLDLEHERGYTQAVEARAAVGDASCCWDKGLVRSAGPGSGAREGLHASCRGAGSCRRCKLLLGQGTGQTSRPAVAASSQLPHQLVQL